MAVLSGSDPRGACASCDGAARWRPGRASTPPAEDNPPSVSVLLRGPPRRCVSRSGHPPRKNVIYGITPRNAEQTFAADALTNHDIQLVSLTGKAGTGKTLLALASALHVRKQYRQIFVARPIVPLSNKDIGYLPGDVESKLAPYMTPLWDNLKVIQDQFPETDKNHQLIDSLTKEEKLVIEPLSYIRGRSLQRIFFIVDEAQNLTPHEIKTIITRAGEGSKLSVSLEIFTR